MRAITVILCSFLLVAPVRAAGALDIVVLDGEGASARAGARRGAPISVLVRDSDQRPVAGASVSAVLPTTGAGGQFDEGGTMATRQTGADGKVHFRDIRLSRVPGEYSVRLVAMHQNRTGSTTVTQRSTTATTSTPAPAVREGRYSRRTVLMMVIGGAAVAAGILAATHDPDPVTPGTSFVITPGSPNLTGPR